MEFNDALVACGIDPDSVDRHKIGEWQRLPTQDHPRKKNGAVHMYESDPPAAFVQNWATGISAYAGGRGWFNSRDTGITPDKKFRKERELFAHLGMGGDTTQQDVAHATDIELDSLRRASPTHPYLTRKKIKPHGIYQKFEELIVPLRTTNTFWSYQRIKPDGSKFFRKGGRTKGCYFPIGGPAPDGSIPRILVCEGFATGASLHEATDLPVGVAFTAGNLADVAVNFKVRNPDSTIVIAADNDSQTVGNRGLSQARNAAALCDGIVICPNFGDAARTKNLTDWNDMSVEYGPEFCRTEVERLLEQFYE